MRARMSPVGGGIDWLMSISDLLSLIVIILSSVPRLPAVCLPLSLFSHLLKD